MVADVQDKLQLLKYFSTCASIQNENTTQNVIKIICVKFLHSAAVLKLFSIILCFSKHRLYFVFLSNLRADLSFKISLLCVFILQRVVRFCYCYAYAKHEIKKMYSVRATVISWLYVRIVLTQYTKRFLWRGRVRSVGNISTEYLQNLSES